MDLSFTPEQREYRRHVRAWLENNLPENWGSPFQGPAEHEENHRFQCAWERKLFDAGLRGVFWPKVYGGQGLSVMEHLILAEELGRVAAPEGSNFTGIELAGPMILAVGTEEQKKRFIRPILSVEEIWCQGFSEPGAGSDLASVRTAARRDGDDWLISGQKVWTSNAHVAHWCLLIARTDPDAKRPHLGLSVFVVPMSAPGISVRPLVQITGRRDFNEVFFDNVRVSGDAMLGRLNDGWRVINSALAVERGTQRLYRQARFANEFRELVNALSGCDQETRRRLARLCADLRIHRLYNLRLIARILAGETVGSEVSMSKLFWSTYHQRLAGWGLEALLERAAAAEVPETTLQRFRHLYLQSRAETIYAGTEQIQRNIIAERVLGLPR